MVSRFDDPTKRYSAFRIEAMEHAQIWASAMAHERLTADKSTLSNFSKAVSKSPALQPDAQVRLGAQCIPDA